MPRPFCCAYLFFFASMIRFMGCAAYTMALSQLPIVPRAALRQAGLPPEYVVLLAHGRGKTSTGCSR